MHCGLFANWHDYAMSLKKNYNRLELTTLRFQYVLHTPSAIQQTISIALCLLISKRDSFFPMYYLESFRERYLKKYCLLIINLFFLKIYGMKFPWSKVNETSCNRTEMGLYRVFETAKRRATDGFRPLHP